MSTPLIIAHRGYSAEALENSRDAFRRALDCPVDMIELDLHAGSDGVLYVMHDRTTGRTADRDVHLERASSAEIATIHLRNGETIPTLADVLALVDGKAGLNLELKGRGTGHRTAELLATSGYGGHVLISSFKEDEVRAALSRMPELPAALIYDVFSTHEVALYRARGYRIVSLRRNTVSEKLIAAFHEANIGVYVWTVDDPEEMQKLIAWGVDGIYTNDPGVLRGLVSR